MKDLEVNKIFAAFLVAAIIAMLSGFIAEIVTHPHDLEKDAIEIESADNTASSSGPAKEVLPDPILALLATADIERGQKISKACAACHSFTKGGANGVGPNLWDIVGAPKQSKDGYSYSGVLNANGTDEWSYQALNLFLAKPKKYAPGTKMNYLGLKKTQDRANMIAWLRTLADQPLALPNQAEIDAEAPKEVVEEAETASEDSSKTSAPAE